MGQSIFIWFDFIFIFILLSTPHTIRYKHTEGERQSGPAGAQLHISMATTAIDWQTIRCWCPLLLSIKLLLLTTENSILISLDHFFFPFLQLKDYNTDIRFQWMTHTHTHNAIRAFRYNSDWEYWQSVIRNLQMKKKNQIKILHNSNHLNYVEFIV